MRPARSVAEEELGLPAKVSLPAAAETPSDEDSKRRVDDEVRRAQIDILFRTAPAAAVAAVLSGILLVAGLKLVFDLDTRRVVAWAALQLSTFVLFETSALIYWLSEAARRNWRLSARILVATTFVGGLGWGLGANLLLSPSTLPQELMVVLVISCLASGTVLALGSYLPAAFGHFLPLMIPLLLRSMLQNDPLHMFLSAMGLFYLLGISLLAYAYSRNLTNSLRLQIENRDLVAQLQREKNVVEQASVAKSRFLASASHDLRQPVHALSMFVGALLDKPLAADSHRLVQQISGAIETMDGLFQSLLDISKLDAGVVHSRMHELRLGPLLDRIGMEFQAQAQAKGLKITVCPSSAVVWTDPVLLENILRNLVANAVRYTRRGRILIGCRRGARLRIEVIDTGIGIAPEHLKKVFEEFYQVGNSERDRSQGLGLGLAIVKRTAALLDCDIEVESELGRGTHVKLSAPLALPRATPGAPPLPEAAATFRPGLIFMVDDDRTIREAMSSLLRGWGHKVVTAETGDEILRRAAESGDRPDLLICDYRLRNDENGVELMQRLQSEYNFDIPGILLTGDTASGRLAEAQASGFLVMHKPVSSARLLAAINAAMTKPGADGVAAVGPAASGPR